jgi:chemotaxis protein MotB
MARRRGGGGGSTGAPEWLVTFSDLMSLLCCFFVLIISFSSQDQTKIQIVAGSLQDAFGIRPEERRAAIVEIEGVPVRKHLKDVAKDPEDTDSSFATERNERNRQQGPESNTHDIEKDDEEKPRQFASAAASLRQAWQEMPDIAEISKNILMEETKDGLHIQLIDQDGRSMFPQGSKVPYEVTRRLLQTMAGVIRGMPHTVQISGHTTAGQAREGGVGIWELSTERALAVRQILAGNGVPHQQFDSVVGRADVEPLFANDPFLPANRRISILLMHEKPPLPTNFQP